MPYINHARRAEIFDLESGDIKSFPETAGELNFLLTTYIIQYLNHKADKFGQCGYQELNEVIGVLEACKLEFYRRLAAPYEDGKIHENGDVY